MKSETMKEINNNSSVVNQLVVAIKDWESKGNKISDSDMFYYCPWFTGIKDNQYKKVA